MNALFLYLLKSSGWIIAFWLIYILFLKKEKFFLFNRVFLFSGLISSLLLPFLQYRYIVEITARPLSTNIATYIPPVTEPLQPSLSWESILLISYSVIVISLLIYNLSGFFRFKRVIRTAEKKGKDKIFSVSSIPESFSYLDYIVLGNQTKKTSFEKEIILEHEKAHVGQKHWIDLLLMQFVCILLWFNPVVWLYKKLLKENQEYLADEAVLKKGISPIQYQAVLINQTFNKPIFEIASSFSKNKLKRITMMKKKTSKPIKKLSAFLLLPALALFLWAFAKPEYKVVTKDVENSTHYVQETDSVDNEKILCFVDGKEVAYITTEELNNSTEEEFAKLCLTPADEILEITVLKDKTAIEKYGEKGKNGVIIVTTKNGKISESKIEEGIIKTGAATLVVNTI